MSKYRPLTIAELQSLEHEFIEFLVINGITANDWVAIKKNDPERASQMTIIFSDVVFEEILRKNQYLIFVAASQVHCFQFLKESVQLIGLESKNADFDLSQLILDPITLENCQIYFTEKSYQHSRELEMFQLVSKGGEMSDGALFKKLALLYAASLSRK